MQRLYEQIIGLIRTVLQRLYYYEVNVDSDAHWCGVHFGEGGV